MKSAISALFAVAAATMMTLSGNGANAQEAQRLIERTQDADYFGFDLRAEKDITLEQCEAACLADSQCMAYTYNLRASWCFLKSDFNTLNAFAGAVAGKVVEIASEPDIGAAPRADFVPGYLMDGADRLSRKLEVAGDTRDPAQSASLIDAASTAFVQGNHGLGRQLLVSALGFGRGTSETWLDAAKAANIAVRQSGNGEYATRELAVSLALNAYALSRTKSLRAEALASLAQALEQHNQHRPALTAYQRSLELETVPQVQAAYRDLRERKGFRVTGNSVNADSSSPSVCAEFSEELVKNGVDYSKFAYLEGQASAAIEASGSRICAEGLDHGKNYTLVLRAGLPSSVGEVLEAPVTVQSYVRDRAPAVRFSGERFVLPGYGRHGIPVTGINAASARLELFRIGDRALAQLLSGNDFLGQLEGYSVDTIRENLGEPVWSGSIELAMERNKESVTSFPVDEALPDRKPGIYAMTAIAEGSTDEDWQPRATQWFLVSDIGLTTYAGGDGMTVFARSLDSARPLAGVTMTLIARNNEVLGTVATDSRGIAVFEPGLMRGTGGLSPALVTAKTGDGETPDDFVFLDIARAGFDLSDRGVEGREAPGPIDIHVWLDRGIYRPGESVHAMALARDDGARAIDGIPLTLVYKRPDGVEAARQVSATPRAGGHESRFDIPDNAMRGVWLLDIHTDPDAAPLAEQMFLVEDFVPDRLEFDLEAETEVAERGKPAILEIDGRFLYGAPAANLALEGDVRIATTRILAAAPGYLFGLSGEEGDADSFLSLSDLGRTDASGRARIEAPLGDLPQSTRPLEATVAIRLREDGGRAIERRLVLPIRTDGVMIGVKPDFGDDGVRENSEAGFRIIALDPQGQRVDLAGLNWTLYRLERNYQWYRDGAYWRYESSVIPKLLEKGMIDASASEAVAIAAGVEWGEYRLDVESADASGPATSIEFNAGYYVTGDDAETPDALEIGLDKTSYAAGETARLQISPRFAGEVQIVIGADRIVETMVATVPAEGLSMEIPVSADWGAGAYVTATLFRPGNGVESRMPSRAIGTTWLSVDPGEREMMVTIDMPEQTRPDGPMTASLQVDGVPAGETAHVTLALVDVGILNLTRHEAPDPVDWYFGQRKLGLEIRDLYGKLIDGSQGAFGRIRTGGDAPGMSAQGSPPTEKLLALFSGILTVDAEGKASVDFELPPFNGTARAMAVAWSQTALGKANRDIIIREPLVITAGLPKVMAPGDTALTVLEIANTDGPEGEYELAVAAQGGIEVAALPARIDLKRGERKTITLSLAALEPGTGLLEITASHGTDILVSRQQQMKVRPAALPVTTRIETPLASNGGSVTIDAGILGGSIAAGSSVSVSVSSLAALNVPALLMKLDRYPYGCAEQTTSRAMPLLYVGDFGLDEALAGAGEAKERIENAIERVLSYQGSNGAFGLWGPGGDDFWLDAYVTDFLTRAQEKGHMVPEQAMRLALTNLQNKLGYQSDLSENGNSVAYGLYVLARNRMASAGDLRYYADTKLEEFATPLARAQIAAALSLYNEIERSNRAFASALALAQQGDAVSLSRADYGSGLRDGAAMLALASETRPITPSATAMAELVKSELALKQHTSTQEDAWMLLAARSAAQANRDLQLEVNGQPRTGAVSMRMDGGALAGSPVRIANRGSRELTAVVTAIASPVQAPPAGGDGFAITREVYRLDGSAVENLSEVAQNERFVVVLKAREFNNWNVRALVSDLLPGGFEIDNPRLVGSAELSAFSWLGQPDAAHSEFRDDRFVVAFNRTPGSNSELTAAYVIRAVTPGDYTWPAAVVEDMYRPEFSARTAEGFVRITPVTRPVQ